MSPYSIGKMEKRKRNKVGDKLIIYLKKPNTLKKTHKLHITTGNEQQQQVFIHFLPNQTKFQELTATSRETVPKRNSITIKGYSH